MEITWLGYSCFKLKGKTTTVITDPFPPNIGYSIEKPTADIVTVSHMHPDHSYVQAIDGNPKTIYRPGEYEIGGVLIIGLPAYHDDEKGIVHGKNSVFAIEIDDISIVHLGDLGHPLSASQIELLGNVDILLLPVGGGSTISASQAAALVRSMDAKIVIPMHYKTLTLTKELDGVDKFLKEMGITESVPQPKLTITKSTIPQNTQVVVLSC